MTNKINLLVIEDQEKHIEDARKYFSEPARSAIVEPRFCDTLSKAEGEIASGRYHGVISDMFFPIGYDNPKRKEIINELERQLTPSLRHLDEKYKDAFRKWVTEESLPPSGVIAVISAINAELPVIINTAAHHHASAFEPINRWRGAFQDIFKNSVGVIESGSYDHLETESESKKWNDAYFRISLGAACKNPSLDFCNIREFMEKNKTEMRGLIDVVKHFDYYQKEVLKQNSEYRHYIPRLKKLAEFKERYAISQTEETK